MRDGEPLDEITRGLVEHCNLLTLQACALEVMSGEQLVEQLAILGLGQYGPSFTENNLTGRSPFRFDAFRLMKF